MYGHGFYELSCMLMKNNVNNNVSKDSPVLFSEKMTIYRVRINKTTCISARDGDLFQWVTLLIHVLNNRRRAK